MRDARLTGSPGLAGMYFNYQGALVMTDQRYFSLLLWTISVLMFACGVVALAQHPEWFGA